MTNYNFLFEGFNLILLLILFILFLIFDKLTDEQIPGILTKLLISFIWWFIPLFNFILFYNDFLSSSEVVDEYKGILYKEIMLTWFLKMVLCVFLCLAIRLYRQYFFIKQVNWTYIFAILLSYLGFCIIISVCDLISLVVSIELASLSLYFLVSYTVGNSWSSEAGLKYLLAGTIGSGFIIFGASLIYGFASSCDLANLHIIMRQLYDYCDMGELDFPHKYYLGWIFLFFGIILKLGLAPLHAWLPDTYEGAPISTTLIVTILPKIPYIFILATIVTSMLDTKYMPLDKNIYAQHILSLLIIVSLASIILGVYGTYQQESIKRLIAYSSISNMGFALLPIATGPTSYAVSLSFMYLIVYMVETLIFFGIYANLRSLETDIPIRSIHEFQKLREVNKPAALGLTTVFLSSAGMPPFAGFFTKMLIIFNLLEKDYWTLGIIILICSVLMSFIYFRMIKIINFPTERWISAYSDQKVPPFIPLSIVHSFTIMNGIILIIGCISLISFVVIFDYSFPFVFELFNQRFPPDLVITGEKLW